MKKLFFTRMLLYIAAVLIPYFHPAVAVTYDRIGAWTYFFTVPSAMLMAYFLRRPRFSLFVEIFVPAGILALLSLSSATLDRQVILMVAASIYAYASTRIVFMDTGRGPTFAVIEMFLVGGVYYRIINFSRSSEELAQKSAEWTIFLLVFAVAAFFLHAIVLYLAAFPDRTRGRKRKELAVFAGILIIIGVPFALLMPKDFVSHKISLNDLEDEPPPNPSPLDGNSNSETNGAGRSGRSRQDTQNGKPLGNRMEKYPSELQGGGSEHQGAIPEKDFQEHGQGGSSGKPQQQQGEGKQGKDSSKKQPRLEGVPADQWNNYNGSEGSSDGGKGQGREGGKGNKDRKDGKGNQDSGEGNSKGEGSGGKQKAVMIVVSPVNPVYAASDYNGDFDREKGFKISEDVLINRLKNLRLLETWKNFEHTEDAGRKPFDIFYLSSIDYRVIAYRPESVEPTVMDKKYHPFDLSYKANSLISMSGPEDWKNISELSYEESRDLQKFLTADLDPEDRKIFTDYLKKNLGTKEGYFERVQAILLSFKDFQYELGMDEDMTVPKLKKFLTETKTGDCTEFSNTVALLGRLAGIPSRVVLGYVASRDLQTPAHRRGVNVLRKSIPLLQKYPASNIYLVTTAHRHAWVQFYMPGYGWVDIETTSYAKPPKPEMDPNGMDVVIPLIEERPNLMEKKFKMPWRFLGRTFFILVCMIVAGLYIFRYGREIYFYVLSKRNTDRGLTALYSFVLMRLAANGYPLKQPWKTPKEYAVMHPGIAEFAELYTMLRFREMYGPGEKEKIWSGIRNASKAVLRETRRKGFFRMIFRWINLRGIYY